MGAGSTCLFDSTSRDSLISLVAWGLTQILNDVQQIQTQVQSVSQQMGNLQELMLEQFALTDCLVAQNQYSTYMGSLDKAWIDYAGFTPSGLQAETDSTILPMVQRYASYLQTGQPLSPAQQQELTYIDKWADKTLSSNGLYPQILTFGSFIRGSGSFQSQPIALCARAAYLQWTQSNQMSPVDDRQYYGPLFDWLVGLITLQVQALQILQQANLWK